MTEQKLAYAPEIECTHMQRSKFTSRLENREAPFIGPQADD
jgi:hypothetical protein